MIMRNQGKYVQFLVGLALLSLASQHVTYTLAALKDEYSYVAGDPKEPSKWGDLNPEWEKCKSGTMQDPIDVPVPTVSTVPSIGQLSKAYQPANAVLTKDHKVKLTEVSWQTGDAGSIFVDGKINYTLTNIHWHAPSEHHLAGKKFELERHMVHLTNAPDVTSKVVVISQLYEFGAPDPFLAELMDEITHANETLANVTVDPVLAGNNGPNFFRYTGSLTTPPCSEEITWVIDNTIATVAPEQVEAIRTAIKDEGEGNARPIQPLNNRAIIYGPFDGTTASAPASDGASASASAPADTSASASDAATTPAPA